MLCFPWPSTARLVSLSSCLPRHTLKFPVIAFQIATYTTVSWGVSFLLDLKSKSWMTSSRLSYTFINIIFIFLVYKKQNW